MKEAPSPESIIEPSKFSFPPRASSSSNLTPDSPFQDRPYLPPRGCCNYYVSRFFEEVHCIYWLYPIEHFHARLDDTYAGFDTLISRSWLCSLYSICALGAAEGNKSNNPILVEVDEKTSLDYLALAKALLPKVHDEADIDSVRALAILVRILQHWIHCLHFISMRLTLYSQSIALQTFGFRITSYLHMGTSIRIAFSLGLQHDRPHISQSLVTRQRNRRIWWTLYLLDQSIASRCGSPCAIDERSLSIQTSFPAEQVRWRQHFKHSYIGMVYWGPTLTLNRC